MKTKLLPIEVNFDKDGYKDLVSKIEKLEEKNIELESVIQELSNCNKNLIDNLKSNFNIPNLQDLEYLFSGPQKIYLVKNNSKDEKITFRVAT